MSQTKRYFTRKVFICNQLYVWCHGFQKLFHNNATSRKVFFDFNIKFGVIGFKRFSHKCHKQKNSIYERFSYGFKNKFDLMFSKWFHTNVTKKDILYKRFLYGLNIKFDFVVFKMFSNKCHTHKDNLHEMFSNKNNFRFDVMVFKNFSQQCHKQKSIQYERFSYGCNSKFGFIVYTQISWTKVFICDQFYVWCNGFQNLFTPMSQAERYSNLRFSYGFNIKFDFIAFKTF